MKRMMSAYLILLGFATLYGQQGGDAVDFKKILVNHVGFTPQGAKYCLIAGNTSVAYEIIDTATGQAAFAGRTTLGGPDLGSFQVGDFSALTQSGIFQVRAGNGRSGSFGIASDAYEDALRKILGYFMEPGSRWWVGINANLASMGVGLVRAARLLKEPRLAALAQRQLDWILGVNPFDASTMTGVGRNQPRQFVTGEFKPVTPLIDGAVMNGIGGTPDDQPDLKPGSWQTCEYWTPMVCYTMWLMSELSAK